MGRAPLSRGHAGRAQRVAAVTGARRPVPGSCGSRTGAAPSTALLHPLLRAFQPYSGPFLSRWRAIAASCRGSPRWDAGAVVRVGLLGWSGAGACPNLPQRRPGPGQTTRISAEYQRFPSGAPARSGPLWQIWTNSAAAGLSEGRRGSDGDLAGRVADPGVLGVVVIPGGSRPVVPRGRGRPRRIACYASSRLLRPFTLRCTRKRGVAEGEGAQQRGKSVVDAGPAAGFSAFSGAWRRRPRRGAGGSPGVRASGRCAPSRRTPPPGPPTRRRR